MRILLHLAFLALLAALVACGVETGTSAVPGPALQIATTTLDDGQVDVFYSAALAASGGTTPYTWLIVSGSLPAGLLLDPDNGHVQGTPTTPGTSDFTVQVKDADPLASGATRALRILVADPSSICDEGAIHASGCECGGFTKHTGACCGGFWYPTSCPPADGPKNINHSYPRIGLLQWCGGTADWFGRFDLVINGQGDPLRDERVAFELSRSNPATYLLATKDWNAGGPFRGTLPLEWALKHSDGSNVTVYDNELFADVTDFCPRLTQSVEGWNVTDERFNEALPRRLWEEIDWETFDGVNSDGSWTFPWFTDGDIDLDRNGINDFTEHGDDWIRAVWWAGQDVMRNNLRSRFAAEYGRTDKKLITYWVVGEPMSIDTANGAGWENMYINGPRQFPDWPPIIEQWQSQGPEPRVNFMSGDLVYDSGNAPARNKDYFRLVRWFLATALLHDAYFMTGDLLGHFWNNYYDEFDVPLGYPLGPAQALPNGAWVRFFDGGASIVNPTQEELTVTDVMLQTLAGYAGPYWRFQGNQDPIWNNGQLFDSVTMASTPPAEPSFEQNVGDGILLVREPMTVVADIIIDNAYPGTSPGSVEATLTGFLWEEEGSYSPASLMWITATSWQGDPLYDAGCSAPPGNGSATAVFEPTINVAGLYRVYEWHGFHGWEESSHQEATNVPVRVVDADGTSDVVVDQSQNAGEWNLLGTFRFDSAGESSVSLTNSANGYVVADAVKFEYVGP